MTFPLEILDHQEDCLQKCFYMMNLIRNKSPEVWEMYQPAFETLKSDESWEFYQTMVAEYQALLDSEKPAKKKKAKKKLSARKKR